jgi:hypothetical protein
MTQFTAHDPNVEVIGAAILATIDGMEVDITSLLEKHGIETVEMIGWYSQQAWLDVLRAISEGNGYSMLDLVGVGMRIPDNAVWPPEVDSVEKALQSINIAYNMNHRGGEIGSYAATVLGEGHMRLTCDNPYPSDFDYGIIYRTVQKFLPEDQGFTVRRADSPSRLKGDRMCIYDVAWG